jgi:adenine phosphoribosyltransferase
MSEPLEVRIRRIIRDVPDFPKPGILFRDITPLLHMPEVLVEAVDAMWHPFQSDGVKVIAGIESRGFIFATAMALKTGLPFVPLRKPGKLPAATYKETYDLEYGQDAIEMHRDAIRPGERVLIVDDLLATGGTAAAATRLVSNAGGDVAACSFLIELADLGGRRLLEPHPVRAVVAYG